jgi:transcriptional regulator with XRE-family HTH domain
MPDLRKLVVRKVINCAKPGTLYWQDICKTVLSEFQDQRGTPPRPGVCGGIVKEAVVKRIANPVDKHVGSRIRMRRLMLGMSQEKLGDGLGLTFQQVQKYEKGTNRVGASRLQHISQLLQVPVPFFFEGAPHLPGEPSGIGPAPSPAYVFNFLATTDGLALTKAFMQIKQTSMRRRIVHLVEEIAGDDLS